jgi:uncharacterized repeat protein (TIGR03803 family)
VPIEMHSVKSDFRELPGRGSVGERRWFSYLLGLWVVFIFMFIFLVAVHIPARAQSYSDNVIYSFNGGSGGNEPVFSGVVQDKAGNFYGTTYAGGAYKYGIVFKVDPSGNETVLHSFGQGRDGRTPYGGLAIDPAGHLYGATNQGGIWSKNCTAGCGIVYEIEPDGQEKLLHAFAGGADGASPYGSLTRDAAGNLYGTTEMGGEFNYGTIFKIDRNGTETVLYSFPGQPGGQMPQAGVIRDAAGNLYGTTVAGGTYNYGSVFEFSASGEMTLLYSFVGGSDGESPDAPLFRTSNGNLYGTTFEGGNGLGTVFKVDTSGKETVVHPFGDFQNDGDYPESPLASDSKGNLYGTTIQGGTGGSGVVYQISTQGVYSVVYDFATQAEGGGPNGPLLAGSNGKFYGTTSSGGTANSGTVYELIP